MTAAPHPRTPADAARLERFERRATMPIFLSAVLPIVLTMAGAESVLASVVLVVTWLVFVADLAVHVHLVPGYLRSGRGRFDLAVVVLTGPWFLAPGLGDARFTALARLARLARVAKAGGGRFVRLARQLGRVGLVTAGLILTCAYVAYSVERSVNDSFGSYGDAVWWATVTMTTVGYGDIYPVTTTGRVTASVLMFAGLAVLGVLAGTLANFFGLASAAEAEAEAEADATAVAAPVGLAPVDAAALRARLAELERLVGEVRRQLDGPDAGRA